MSKAARLRILIANERLDRLELLAGVVEGLGHQVVARSVTVREVAAATARERPDVALVGLGDSSDHAFEMVSEIVREAYCPVIAILTSHDSPWVSEAANRGLYASVIDGSPEELPKVVFLSRFSAELVAVDVLAHGADRYIEKGAHPEAIADAIEAAGRPAKISQQTS